MRHTKNTPDKLKIKIETPEGVISYTIPIMKVKKYKINDIFQKKLFFLIPFYIFSFETELDSIAKNNEKLILLKEEYSKIRRHLDKCCEQKDLSEYTKRTIIKMTQNVVNSLAKDYDIIQKGVVESMGGKILEYEEKDILNRGRQEGRQEAAQNLIKKGILTLEEIAECCGLTLAEVKILSK